MAQSVEYNQKVDKNQNYVFEWGFYEDDETTPIDISTWTFKFLLKDTIGATVWSILNSGFVRDGSYISFTKTVAQMASLSGIYTISLLVTNATSTDDEYVHGSYYFSQ